ncbi:MAG: DUF3429 family protein [Gammaproteobacteria bacterium]|nr:DUF3429 family protein [Gammaproteobacteria bacterium]NKB63191.1 DUF3429 family protein [Gammaproteobacteria bacterium]
MANNLSESHALKIQGRCYGYLGLLPFFIGLLGPLWLPIYENVFHHGFIIYSYLIFAFLSGTLWFAAIVRPEIQNDEKSVSLGLAMAIFFSLLPLISFYLGLINLPTSIGLMLLGYPALWLWEGLSRIRNSYPHWYRSLRLQLTVIVTLCHLVFLLLKT